MNKHIGKSYDKVDSKGILSGKPSYTGDFVPKDALVIKALRSPHAQARIKSIDTSKAKLIPGVEAIFTYEDVPNTRFTLAGQTYPEPSAYDALILDPVVRSSRRLRVRACRAPGRGRFRGRARAGDQALRPS